MATCHLDTLISSKIQLQSIVYLAGSFVSKLKLASSMAIHDRHLVVGEKSVGPSGIDVSSDGGSVTQPYVVVPSLTTMSSDRPRAA